MPETQTINSPAPGQVNEVDAIRALGEALNGYLKPSLDEGRVGEIVDERIAQARLPRQIEVRVSEDRSVVLDERVHRQFDELLSLVQEGHKNLLMVGPAGSGKTTLAKSVAKALELDFAFISLSAGVTETHLFGRILPQADGSWSYRPSRFVEVYEKGGLFLLDEVDAADGNLMVAVNAALANGILANPVSGQLHQRHEDCYVLAAANTWLKGGDTQYVGRNQQDGAFTDRFVMSKILIDYDVDLERDIAQGSLPTDQAAELLGWVELLRERIKGYKLRRIASTRLIIGAVKAMQHGKSLDDVKRRFFLDWTVDEKAKVGE